MKQQNRYRPYEERFITFSDVIEKLLIKLIIIFIAGLIITQSLLSFDGLREIFIQVEQMEGSIGQNVIFRN